ncbi:UDP-rhamnose/UDP-galactose transporter 1-like isoform X3 [Actinidia eriantha]|uniref:UDP-rhamnose/UDP-galactose transporter 1-like isoform X3 n=1 Tax=Actinidia eriantha TaxID=165200 RepID=UPI00258CB8AC|nr:UDP-rhamnose/UDP-galactose transporter 1-like isoform X3 [Actinidia eriantha]
MEGEKKSAAISDVGAWAMNVISSVGIILANKQLMSLSGYAFTFATTLTGFHFAVTAIVGQVSNATGYSASKRVPLWELLWFSIVANMSITGMNFSLMLNSVGFYQAFSLLLLGPFIDCYLSGKFIANYKLSSGAVLFILLSCSLAVFCNVSQYLCIGRFSAVSFQVLGHMKTGQPGLWPVGSSSLRLPFAWLAQMQLIEML